MLTRRDLLKLGLTGGGYFILGPDGTITRADDFDDFPSSPYTEPFVDELPFPPIAQEAPFCPEDLPAEYREYWVNEDTTRFFKIASEQRQVHFHKHLPATTIWGYRDLSPCAQRTVGAGTLTPLEHILGPTLIQLFGGLGPERNAGGAYSPLTPIGGGFVVRHINCLPKYHRGFGVPRTTVHLHGGHHLARADGFPENLENPPSIRDGFPSRIVMEPGFVLPAEEPPPCPVPPQLPPLPSDFCGNVRIGNDPQVLDYYYPILDPGELDSMLGLSDDAPDRSERPSTQWYHDHLLDFTGPNAYRGLAGFVLCFDEKDSNDENDPTAGALRLPSGRYDIPLAIQDKQFDRNGNLVFSSFDHDGFVGDKFLVNGKIQPYLNVARRKYRFRVLNASNARLYQLFLSDDQYSSHGMDMIATEGGLLHYTIRDIPSFLLSMAERVEVIIDFARFPIGKTLYLENRLFQDDGRKPDGLRSRGDWILKFHVDREARADEPGPATIPHVLREFDAIDPSKVQEAYSRLRTFEFDRSHGAWTINGELAGHLERPVAEPRRGIPEIWRLRNNSGGWWHPIHIHSEFFRVIKRNGRTPSIPANGRAWVPGYERDGYVKKDTILLRDNESVDVFLNFRDHLGPFVFHCHNMEHEDMAMMARFDVVP